MTTFVLAFYEVDRAYGGPEEGGWWFDTGQLVRILALFKDEERAYAAARRANQLLEYLQRHRRPVGSVIYSGGRHEVAVFENFAPPSYPETRPRYE